MADYTIEIINNQPKLANLLRGLAVSSEFAIDIETVDWWNRHRERIALVQIAFGTTGSDSGGGAVKIAVIDARSELELKTLGAVLESSRAVKIIHNAAFDATRLFRHYKLKTAPIYDTMLAARRNGEKRCSLQAQVFTHLNLRLDKAGQRSDWSRRPLDLKQINYAALDAYAALQLYRHQLTRNLNGSYRLKDSLASLQGQLPLEDVTKQASPAIEQDVSPQKQKEAAPETAASAIELSAPLAALLGIVSELPTRYGPESLSVAVGTGRVGLAGWIVDRTLGRDADFDEETARLAIAELFEQKLIRLTETRRLEATEEGNRIWRKMKPV